VVDPTTQRSLVVRQSDEVQTSSSDVLIKPQSAPCSTPVPKQSSELRCPPPLQGIVLFFRQSPVRKNRGRRKCGPPWDLLGNHRSSRSLASKAILRDSRGKEGNLQVRRSSGSLQPSWMAVQPPVVPSSTPSVSPPLHVPPTSPFNSTFHFPRTWVNRHAAHAAPPS